MTLIAYLPQFRRLLNMHSTAGLSITSILANTLVAQVQVATMYYLFKSRPLIEYGVPVADPPTVRHCLNLTQISLLYVLIQRLS